jgi:hypothetical protein
VIDRDVWAERADVDHIGGVVEGEMHLDKHRTSWILIPDL